MQVGLSDFKPELCYGLMAPAKTPASVISRINAALNAVLADRSIRGDLMSKGVTTIDSTPFNFARKIQSDTVLWGNIARSVNAKAE